MGDEMTLEEARDVLNECRRGDEVAGDVYTAIKTIISHINELEAEVKDWEQSFEMYDDAVKRGTAQWHDAHPDKRDMLPDSAKMIEWLCDRMDELGAKNASLNVEYQEETNTVISMSRRLGAADGLLRDIYREMRNCGAIAASWRPLMERMKRRESEGGDAQEGAGHE